MSEDENGEEDEENQILFLQQLSPFKKSPVKKGLDCTELSQVGFLTLQLPSVPLFPLSPCPLSPHSYCPSSPLFFPLFLPLFIVLTMPFHYPLIVPLSWHCPYYTIIPSSIVLPYIVLTVYIL
jgi:hypothetical protein